MSRWVEFFEGDANRLSMTRLLCFMSFFPSSYVLITHPSADMLLWYLASFTAGYAGGKLADAINSKSPDVNVPDAETVNVKADGNVNVTRKGKK